MHLRFDPSSQRLRLIEVYDVSRMQVLASLKPSLSPQGPPSPNFPFYQYPRLQGAPLPLVQAIHKHLKLLM